MRLETKVAVLYGAAGPIGRSVARAFAAEGAHVVLCGRTPASLETVAASIRTDGGDAETASLDATDQPSVEAHLAELADRVGTVDISFNLVGLADVQGQRLVDMTLDNYLQPIDIAATTHFVTATAAARHMASRRSGVIMALTATPSRLAIPLVGGFGTACGAIEGMLRTLAAEVGPDGVRVCWLRSAGSPESFGPGVAADADGRPAGLADDPYLDSLRERTLLRRFPRVAEVASAAVLLASDHASAMTGMAANITCGHLVD